MKCEVCINEVTKEVINNILDNQKSVEKYGEPYQLLWYYDDTAQKYIACDNLHGHAWIEEFDTYEECVSWLLGEIEIGGNV